MIQNFNPGFWLWRPSATHREPLDFLFLRSSAHVTENKGSWVHGYLNSHLGSNITLWAHEVWSLLAFIALLSHFFLQSLKDWSSWSSTTSKIRPNVIGLMCGRANLGCNYVVLVIKSKAFPTWLIEENVVTANQDPQFTFFWESDVSWHSFKFWNCFKELLKIRKIPFSLMDIV